MTRTTLSPYAFLRLFVWGQGLQTGLLKSLVLQNYSTEYKTGFVGGWGVGGMATGCGNAALGISSGDFPLLYRGTKVGGEPPANLPPNCYLWNGS